MFLVYKKKKKKVKNRLKFWAFFFNVYHFVLYATIVHTIKAMPVKKDNLLALLVIKVDTFTFHAELLVVTKYVYSVVIVAFFYCSPS